MKVSMYTLLVVIAVIWANKVDADVANCIPECQFYLSEGHANAVKVSVPNTWFQLDASDPDNNQATIHIDLKDPGQPQYNNVPHTFTLGHSIEFVSDPRLNEAFRFTLEAIESTQVKISIKQLAEQSPDNGAWRTIQFLAKQANYLVGALGLLCVIILFIKKPENYIALCGVVFGVATLIIGMI
ncbi:hypothetical protein [Planctobacterium marinum]|uniref:hypothetical protein n=1 Tax=Planctobacterium marinum TaxID=1631968 RepID=UPI001E462D9C|nr:hypothetical protein [Planctobacterium marinum]MCC2607558.1 hypothetical protein [Planctobacterium marinum]